MMDFIRSIYTNFDELVQRFGEDEIRNEIKHCMNSVQAFLNKLNSGDKLFVCDDVLTYCILDYLSDIKRLSDFHKIKEVNSIKRTAYYVKWFLHRKPIMINTSESEDDNIVYANEKYALSCMLAEIIGANADKQLSEDAYKKYEIFVNTLYYHLKYRTTDAQTLEMIIEAFQAGISFGESPISS